jgi:hypothetical protein
MGDALAAIEETNYLPRRKNGWRPAPPSPPPQLCRTTIIRMDMDLQQTAIIVRSMPEMVASFRVCRIERQLTLETVDAIAGFPAGYSTKLFAPEPIKNLGWMSFGDALGAFGKMLLLVDDPEQIERAKDRWIPRERPNRVRSRRPDE